MSSSTSSSGEELSEELGEELCDELGEQLGDELGEQLGELLVGHQDVLALATKGFEQLVLLLQHHCEVRSQLVLVQLHCRLGVHQDGGVDDAHL